MMQVPSSREGGGGKETFRKQEKRKRGAEPWREGGEGGKEDERKKANTSFFLEFAGRKGPHN